MWYRSQYHRRCKLVDKVIAVVLWSKLSYYISTIRTIIHQIRIECNIRVLAPNRPCTSTESTKICVSTAYPISKPKPQTATIYCQVPVKSLGFNTWATKENTWIVQGNTVAESVLQGRVWRVHSSAHLVCICHLVKHEWPKSNGWSFRKDI